MQRQRETRAHESERVMSERECSVCKRSHVTSALLRIKVRDASRNMRKMRVPMRVSIALVYTHTLGDVCAACAYERVMRADMRIPSAQDCERLFAHAMLHERAAVSADVCATRGGDYTSEMWAYM